MLNLGFNFIQTIKRNLFPFYKEKKLKFVFKTLQEGFAKDVIVARFVGGCVRKHLTNDTIDDIDIATILSSEDIKERFSNTDFKVIDTGIKHGTVTLISGQLKLELTTLRKDIRTDGRHAEVEYINDWQLDSERRDFTINAIYLDIHGKIFDPQMGTVDLKNNNVKFIGDPQKRIEEDFLRIIRFVRFKIMYNGKVEPNTNQAVKHNLNGIKKISKERILTELFKILDLKNFIDLNDHEYLREIFSLIFQQTGHLLPTAFELVISISFSKLLSFETEAEDVIQISEKSCFSAKLYVSLSLILISIFASKLEPIILSALLFSMLIFASSLINLSLSHLLFNSSFFHSLGILTNFCK